MLETKQAYFDFTEKHHGTPMATLIFTAHVTHEQLGRAVELNATRSRYLQDLQHALLILDNSECLTELALADDFELPDFLSEAENVHANDVDLKNLIDTLRVVTRYVTSVSRIKTSGVISAQYIMEKLRNLFASKAV